MSSAGKGIPLLDVELLSLVLVGSFYVPNVLDRGRAGDRSDGGSC